MSTPVMDGPAPTSEDEISVEVGDGAMVLSLAERASIDMQIATAKAYPRQVTKSLNEALSLATLDEETAGSMFYVLPRRDKDIEGPSARLAEVMTYAWGNLRVDADIVGEDRTHLTAVGTCFDLEKNVAVRVRVKRRITDKQGRRFNDDMIGVTANAAISIALRNCVFKVVPRAFVDRIYLAARKASLGEGGTMAQKRTSALNTFGKIGVKREEVFALLGVAGPDDIGEDQLIKLRGVLTAIKDGETTVERVFRTRPESEGASELNASLGAKPVTVHTAAATATATAAAVKTSRQAVAKPIAEQPAAGDPTTPASACATCGGVNGKHFPECPQFAD